jgi:hypothetical protein
MQVSDALFVLTIACARNHKSQPCIRSAGTRLPACLQVNPSGLAPSSIFKRTLYVSSGGVDGCKAGCALQMADMVYDEGCCAATLANAEELWRLTVISNPSLGSRFRVVWNGGRVEEFSTASLCNGGSGGALVDVTCLAGQCGIGGNVWPEACCNNGSVCYNGGIQPEFSSCVCSCPDGWTGPRCTGRAPHVRLGLRVVGTTRRTWTLGVKGRFRSFLAAQLAVGENAVEFDGLPQEEFALTDLGIVKKRRDSGKIVVALRVQMRIIGSSNYEALRVKSAVDLLVTSKVINTSPIPGEKGIDQSIASVGYGHTAKHPPWPLNSPNAC